jgi:hypothetical protein
MITYTYILSLKMLGKNCSKKGKKDLEIEIFFRGHQLEIGFLDTFL